MNRNTESRFALNPKLEISRSRMSESPEVKGTFQLGRLYPLGNPWEVLPGDTWSVNTSAVVRMQPLVSAPMDNLHMDVYFFYIPSRQLWTHFADFMGENKNGHWYPQTQYTVPLVTFYHFAHSKSIADYMGLPVYDADIIYGEDAYSVDALKFRGYCQIWNEWFRDENLQDPVYVDLGDNNYSVYEDESKAAGDATDSDFASINLKQYAYTGQTLCLPVAKTHDMFTSALNSPQKGPDVELMTKAHVYFGGASDAVGSAKDLLDKYGNGYPYVSFLTGGNYGTAQVAFKNKGNSTYYSDAIQPSNWYVDTDFTINEFRTAFAIQKLLEKEARNGSRFTELIRGHFGITPLDASVQRPQYLGGFRKSIATNQLLQTSESGNTPQGNVAGFSLTGTSRDGSWIHSFDEWGYIFPLVSFRIDSHSYSQGIHRSWLRRNKYDYFFPVLQSLGEFPVENCELWTDGFIYDNDPNHPQLFDPFDEVSDANHQVFGYQEAWYDYRYTPNQIIGEMRPGIANSLASWHYGDYYDQRPSLSDDWIIEDGKLIDRALAVSSSVADPFFGDFKFYIQKTRPMPMYSIPGMIDHF